MELKRQILGKSLKIDSIIKNIENSNLKNTKKYKLSLLELRTLLFIQENNIVKPMYISKEFNVTPATITVQVNRLIKKGFLLKKGNEEDRRSVNLFINPEIEKVLNNIIEGKLKSFDSIFNTLTKRDQQQLLDIMEKIETGVEKES